MVYHHTSLLFVGFNEKLHKYLFNGNFPDELRLPYFNYF